MDKKIKEYGSMGFITTLILYILGVYMSGLEMIRGWNLAFWYVVGIVVSISGAVCAVLFYQSNKD